MATVAFGDVEARPVDVEGQIASGPVVFNVVGLGDKAVAESREGVRAALIASGLALPAKRITVNLAPADMPREGSHYDLPVALGVMAAIGAIPSDALDGFAVLGELALDGALTPVAGVLPAAVSANARGLGLICPHACGPEAAWASDEMDVLAPRSLIQLVNHIKGLQALARPAPAVRAPADDPPDLRDIKGQESAKRALEIAAAGGHNLLMSGPPGAGKSMLASRVPSILPPLTPRELPEVSIIHSVAGQIAGGALTDRRPFRAPHHSASMAALVGGGHHARPSEISLAHNGVLLLDELPEFQPQALDGLRQPLETGGGGGVARQSSGRLSRPFPACRGDEPLPLRPCPRPGLRLPASAQRALRGAVSGAALRSPARSFRSAAYGSGCQRRRPDPAIAGGRFARSRGAGRARATQRARYEALGLPGVSANAAAPPSVMEHVARLDGAGAALIRDASEKYALTARGFHRVLRLARTIADLDDADPIARGHLAEALAYRAGLAAGRLAA